MALAEVCGLWLLSSSFLSFNRMLCGVNASWCGWLGRWYVYWLHHGSNCLLMQAMHSSTVCCSIVSSAPPPPTTFHSSKSDMFVRMPNCDKLFWPSFCWVPPSVGKLCGKCYLVIITQTWLLCCHLVTSSGFAAWSSVDWLIVRLVQSVGYSLIPQQHLGLKSAGNSKLHF